MGLFSGILGAIGLGGGQKVSQTSTNQTSVTTEVDIENNLIIDTEKIAGIFEDFKNLFADFEVDLINAGKEEVQVKAALEVAKIQQQQSLIERVATGIKKTKEALIIAGIIGGFWWFLRRKKKRKKRK